MAELQGFHLLQRDLLGRQDHAAKEKDQSRNEQGKSPFKKGGGMIHDQWILMDFNEFFCIDIATDMM